MGFRIGFGLGPFRFSARLGGGRGGTDEEFSELDVFVVQWWMYLFAFAFAGWLLNKLGIDIDIDFVLLYWVLFQGVPIALVLASSRFFTLYILELLKRKWEVSNTVDSFGVTVGGFISAIIFIVGFHKIPLMNPDLVFLSREESMELYGRHNAALFAPVRAAFVAPVRHWSYLYLGASFSVQTILLVIFLGTKFFLRQLVRVLGSKATEKKALYKFIQKAAETKAEAKASAKAEAKAKLTALGLAAMAVKTKKIEIENSLIRLAHLVDKVFDLSPGTQSKNINEVKLDPSLDKSLRDAFTDARDYLSAGYGFLSSSALAHHQSELVRLQLELEDKFGLTRSLENPGHPPPSAQ